MVVGEISRSFKASFQSPRVLEQRASQDHLAWRPRLTGEETGFREAKRFSRVSSNIIKRMIFCYCAEPELALYYLPNGSTSYQKETHPTQQPPLSRPRMASSSAPALTKAGKRCFSFPEKHHLVNLPPARADYRHSESPKASPAEVFVAVISYFKS